MGIKDVPPFYKRQICCQGSGLDLMPLTDDLEEEVRALRAKTEITQLVTNQEIRRLIVVELFE
jgi:hypothetical protein